MNGNASNGAIAEVLTRLRDGGDQPPLYFIPAGYGDMRMFRNVVDLLDADRPVYGLQPPGVERIEGVRGKSVQWLVSTYIAEIKRLQPTGLYHLAGYSTGGLLIVEIARRLKLRGDSVALTAILDAPLQIPPSVIWVYSTVYKLCNLSRLTDAVRWMIIRRWNSLLLRWVSDEGLCTHIAIVQTLSVESYPGRIVYLRPRGSWIRVLNLTRVGKSWHKTARSGLEVHWMPGTHHKMLRGRQAAMVAAVLKASLKRSKHQPQPLPTVLPASWTATRHGKVVYSASVKDGRMDEVFDWGVMEQLHQRDQVPDPVSDAWSEAYPEFKSCKAATSHG